MTNNLDSLDLGLAGQIQVTSVQQTSEDVWVNKKFLAPLFALLSDGFIQFCSLPL